MKQKLNFNAWLKDRDEALFSLDIEKITAYSQKYGLPMPPDSFPNREKIILGGMAKAVLHIKTAPEEVKAKARQILDEYKFSYDIFGCSHAEQKYDDISDIVDNAQHTSSGLLEEI